MAWSKGYTVTNGTAIQKFADLMLNRMNGTGDPTSAKGGWKVGTGGLSGGDIVCLFSCLNGDGVIRHSQFALDVSSANEGQVANTQINQNYDSSITDLSNPNAFPFVVTTDSLDLPEVSTATNVGNLEVWFSSENPTAFLCIIDDRAVGSFFPITQMSVMPLPGTGGDNNNPVTGYVDYIMMLPSFLGFTCYFVGPPIHEVDDDTSMETYGPDLVGNGIVDMGSDIVFKGVTLGDYGISVAKLADDVLWNMPAGQRFGQTMYTCYNAVNLTAANTVQPAFDGTKYWLYLNNYYGAGPTASCWVLDLGSNQYSYSAS